MKKILVRDLIKFLKKFPKDHQVHMIDESSLGVSSPLLGKVGTYSRVVYISIPRL